jgi:polysaccharide deacetylase family protein (PEP-CTERM system associated)
VGCFQPPQQRGRIFLNFRYGTIDDVPELPQDTLKGAAGSMHPLRNLPNFLTFDIEEWYRVNYDGASAAGLSCPPGWMERLTDTLLDICHESGYRSTFFVLGSVAEAYPQVVKRIAAAGHEVASHSYGHKSVFGLTPVEFEEDLRRSCGILGSLTGKATRGFRAPSFSVTREVLPWFYDALERAGLDYSSSVFPGRTFLYGIPDFPNRVHRPLIEGRRSAITEFPMTRVNFAGKTIGLYVRLFPASFLRWFIGGENAAGRPATLYVHPREIDPDQPRLALPWPQSYIHYFGVRGCEKKLRCLLRTAPGPFVSIAEALDRYPGFSEARAT